MPRYTRLGAYDEVALTLSQSDYDVGDVIGGVQTIPRGNDRASVILQNLVVVDTSNLMPGLDIFLFVSQPSLLAVDNEPFDLSAAEIAKCPGVVHVRRCDYSSSMSNSVATRRRLELGLRTVGYNVYAVAVLTRALLMPFPVDALTLRYHFELERV